MKTIKAWTNLQLYKKLIKQVAGLSETLGLLYRPNTQPGKAVQVIFQSRGGSVRDNVRGVIVKQNGVGESSRES